MLAIISKWSWTETLKLAQAAGGLVKLLWNGRPREHLQLRATLTVSGTADPVVIIEVMNHGTRNCFVKLVEVGQTPNWAQMGLYCVEERCSTMISVAPLGCAHVVLRRHENSKVGDFSERILSASHVRVTTAIQSRFSCRIRHGVGPTAVLERINTPGEQSNGRWKHKSSNGTTTRNSRKSRGKR